MVLTMLLARLYVYLVNNRDKVICVRNLEPQEIADKVQLLLDSSGDKLKLEKGHPVKSTTESVRGKPMIMSYQIIADRPLTLLHSLGIYSPFHTPWKGAENLGKIR